MGRRRRPRQRRFRKRSRSRVAAARPRKIRSWRRFRRSPRPSPRSCRGSRRDFASATSRRTSTGREFSKRESPRVARTTSPSWTATRPRPSPSASRPSRCSARRRSSSRIPAQDRRSSPWAAARTCRRFPRSSFPRNPARCSKSAPPRDRSSSNSPPTPPSATSAPSPTRSPSCSRPKRTSSHSSTAPTFATLLAPSPSPSASTEERSSRPPPS
mmetsp:Transcript_28873/g.93065  ORF Transcript_28873/g.93065 Transcript_28873/m.93065 type:complete len:214 (+) Transcript_28873:620-1261(+)